MGKIKTNSCTSAVSGCKLTKLFRRIKEVITMIHIHGLNWFNLSFYPLPHREAFEAFANGTDPDHAALVRAA